MKKVIFFIVIIFGLQQTYSNSYIITSNYLRAYQHILFFEIDKADNLIKYEINNNTSNLLFYYLNSKNLFVEAFVSETNSSRTRFNTQFTVSELKLKNGNKKSPFYNYTLAKLYLYKGIIDLKFGENIKAGLELRKAFKHLENNNNQFPKFSNHFDELGLFHIILSNIPTHFQWLTNLSGLSANRAMGLKLFRNSIESVFESSNNKIYQLEALLYYFIFLNLEKENEIEFKNFIGFLDKIDRSFETSPIYIFVKSEVLKRQGLHEQSLSILDSYNPKESSMYFYYLDYLKGLILLPNQPNLARSHFLRFINNFEGLHFIKSAYHKIAWSFLLQGNIKDYEKYLILARHSGTNMFESDKQAHIDANKKDLPNKELLKVRLLSDIGDLTESNMIINSIDSNQICKNLIHCIEFHYRQARIHHLSGRFLLAIDSYNRTIDLGYNEKVYFAAKSALLLGNIYEERNQLRKATDYYRQVLVMPFEEYRNSIQQSARDGLSRLKRK